MCSPQLPADQSLSGLNVFLVLEPNGPEIALCVLEHFSCPLLSFSRRSPDELVDNAGVVLLLLLERLELLDFEVIVQR